MTTEVKRQTHYTTAITKVRATASPFRERRSWIPCPRCIGGNMYRDSNGEHVCIQCGCSCDPDKVMNTSYATKEPSKLESKTFQNLLNVLRIQRIEKISNNIDSVNPG